MSELTDIKATLGKILEEQEKQRKELHRMNFVLLGDESSEVEGLAQKVFKHGTYISKDKKQKWVAFGLVLGGQMTLWQYIKAKFGI